jgi:histidinol-phosphate/aromatic aminotransferase/cobyric acid decarboxylase-like protein
MTYELSDKIKNLKPYNAVTGDYKIRMDANESFINPGETLQEEFLSAVASIKFNRYPNPMATELCEGFAISLILRLFSVFPCVLIFQLCFLVLTQSLLKPRIQASY